MEFTLWNVILVSFMAWLVYTVGYLRGWKMREVTAKKYVDDLIQENTKTKTVNIYVKKVDNGFYVYNSENHQYITTVKSIEEARIKLQLLFPKCSVIINLPQAKEEGFIE